MIENIMRFKVQYADTDAYGVMWHGSYLRYMEMGRVELLEDYGIKIDKLQKEQDVIMPVIELDIKYKFSAKLMDECVLRTKIIDLTKTTVTFLQEIYVEDTQKLCTSATVRATALKSGRISREVDEYFKERV